LLHVPFLLISSDFFGFISIYLLSFWGGFLEDFWGIFLGHFPHGG